MSINEKDSANTTESENSGKKIRILLVDDHTLFRSGLKALLQRQSDFQVVGETDNGLDGVKLAEQLQPDVVLLDLDMPVMNGHEALAECMRLGARGYLLKKINTDFLLSGIRHAVEGDSVLSPEMTSKLVMKIRRDHASPATPVTDVNSLTPRERETLAWLAKGVSNKEIARALDLAESTVKVHVQSILRKLNLSSRVQAAVFAVKHHLDRQ